jgi:endonuclease/exonuclease/phosphatase (EEP) superfamily protein YafD
MKRLIVYILVFSVSALGCVTIPDTLTVENRPEKAVSLPAEDLCNPLLEYSAQLSTPSESKALSANGFSLLSWNIQKEHQKGWQRDLVHLSQDTDILILQEAYLTEELKRVLNRKFYYWHLVNAFEYQELKTGVLTAATLAPDFTCPLRAAEPLIRVPKTILITRYPLSDSHRSLMIANVHMINFAPHLTAFYDQVRQMSDVLLHHQGPMILSGDFNTWSEGRLAIIEEMTNSLTLMPVEFKTSLVRKVFGQPVDRVYYRGLTVESARVIEVTSSDHNPLRVRFRLMDES